MPIGVLSSYKDYEKNEFARNELGFSRSFVFHELQQ